MGCFLVFQRFFHRFQIPMTFKSNKNQLREKSHRRGERSNSFIRNWLWNGAVELGHTWSLCAPSTLGEQFHYGGPMPMIDLCILTHCAAALDLYMHNAVYLPICLLHLFGARRVLTLYEMLQVNVLLAPNGRYVLWKRKCLIVYLCTILANFQCW